MKIGIDCRLWNETGIGRYTRNLVNQLLLIDRKNEYVFFVLPKDEENIKSQISNLKKNCKLKIENWKLCQADVKWHAVEEQLKFPRILNGENLDLIHFPYFSVPIFYNRSFVITIHDLIMHHFPTGQASTLPLPIYNLKRLVYKFVLGQAAKNAKKIIAVSSATKDEIVNNLKINPQKIIITYEGADEKITNSKLQIPNKFQNSKYKLSNNEYFVYVGNAFPHKNLERLLQAFRLLCHPELVSGSQDIKLVLVGKEDYFYKRLISKVEKMNLSENVIILQNVSDDELSNLYQNAKALIMPSLMEGFGLPALEAMANNCLVLASDIPALREVCADAAIYFDPYNVNDIAKKLKTALGDDNNEKKKKGLERAKLFSWRKMAKETLKAYEDSISL